MNPEKALALKEHALAIAAILYEETEPEELKTLAGIEKAVREQLVEHVTPHIGVFLSARSQAPSPVVAATSKAAWENFPSLPNKPKNSGSSPTRS